MLHGDYSYYKVKHYCLAYFDRNRIVEIAAVAFNGSLKHLAKNGRVPQ